MKTPDTIEIHQVKMKAECDEIPEVNFPYQVFIKRNSTKVFI
jgi:hypothetical protein